jgi:hypothetical protein
MTQTVQLCSWASLSATDKDLIKPEEEILNLLLSTYDNMSKFNDNLDKLNNSFIKIFSALNIYKVD